MVLSLSRIAVGVVVLFASTATAVPPLAAARELATAHGTVAISEARPGLQPPACTDLVVEARDAIDNHLIAETQPIADVAGTCRYVLSVPAQAAVWLHVQPLLVAGVRVISGARTNTIPSSGARSVRDGIGLRFTIIAPTTYFFAPNEQKTILLNY